MVGEISIGGVFVPSLLATSLVALVLAMLASRCLASFGLHRLFAWRPVVGLSLFVILFGLLIQLAHLFEN
ncbi:DUF1656 domain-containing protein [Pandoraea pulmonicola]|uniref:Protein of uncharacterized function (DUF1656) n=1 Tax=Pandoraea pulmonicola TaxID=93221 RepID=A0AAJ4ZFV8_PANPU|nr:DUF1656 domain-containing protein [Pandoraea pulmonicola]AJC22934.1 hypothetical protein RO07_00845 [Pandoraea pulmonicola]SUA92589.1 Protein of uncharacterised function (DUF1656) [Pandoraea pulmonicola]